MVWQRLCGNPRGQFIHGTLPIETDITCPVCQSKWKEGMKRVAKLFENYRGEE
jgi:hypothetical protein